MSSLRAFPRQSSIDLAIAPDLSVLLLRNQGMARTVQVRRFTVPATFNGYNCRRSTIWRRRFRIGPP
jgi:hypothetical protein